MLTMGAQPASSWYELLADEPTTAEPMQALTEKLLELDKPPEVSRPSDWIRKPVLLEVADQAGNDSTVRTTALCVRSRANVAM